MKLLLVLSFFFYLLNGYGQNCKPNIDIKVNVCGGKYQKDSICPSCYECRARLIATDSNYSVISFKITAWGEGFDDVMEANIDGPFFSNMSARTQLIITRLRPGSFLDISCIRARDKNGGIYILQPYSFTLK